MQRNYGEDRIHEPKRDRDLAAHPGRSDERQLYPAHEIHQKVGVGDTWLAWTVFALCIFPSVLAVLTVPSLGQVYADAGSGPMPSGRLRRRVGEFAGVSSAWRWMPVGIALAFSVILGISAAVGALIPLFTTARRSPRKYRGHGRSGAGDRGVLVCAKAGRAREAALGKVPREAIGRKRAPVLHVERFGVGAGRIGLAYGGRLADGAKAAAPPRPGRIMLPGCH